MIFNSSNNDFNRMSNEFDAIISAFKISRISLFVDIENILSIDNRKSSIHFIHMKKEIYKDYIRIS